jgi:hypothetical protein
VSFLGQKPVFSARVDPLAEAAFPSVVKPDTEHQQVETTFTSVVSDFTPEIPTRQRNAPPPVLCPNLRPNRILFQAWLANEMEVHSVIGCKISQNPVGRIQISPDHHYIR